MPQMGDFVSWVAVVATVITVVGGGLFTIWNRRGGEHARKVPGWNDLVEENRNLRKELDEHREVSEVRFSKIERKLTALVNVVHTLADHWPADVPPPELHPADVAELDTTLPVKFRRGHRPPIPT